MKIEPHKSSTGMDANVWAMLVYIITIILGWIPYVNYVAWVFPLVMFLTEKDSEFVRFHSMQALALYIINAIAAIIFAIIAFAITMSTLGALINPIGLMGAVGGAMGLMAVSAIGAVITVLIMVFTIIATIKAYQYEQYEVPLAGAFAKKLRAMGNK